MKKNQIRKSVAALAMAAVVSVSLLGYGCGSKSASSTAGVSGEFTGTAKGMGGDVTVTLTLTDGKITGCTAEGKDETPGIGTMALEQLPGAIAESGSIAVDGVATATITSDAIKEAAAAALTAAGLPSFGFFEFAWIGIPVSIAGMLYMMFIGKHLLPKVELDADQDIEQEIEATSTDSKKQIISGAILIAVVLVMALDIKGVTLEMAAIIGALICVLTGCLTEKQAYASIDWVTIFLFAGMMPVSTAMDKTGAGKLIAEWTVGLMGGDPSPMVVTAVLFALSCILTQFMSNTASAALLCPIGVAIAKQLNADPKAVIMAIAVAASCAFATPVGTPPNTLVLGPGGYKFMDYVKAGTGLVIVCFIVSLIVIPIVWPFFPGK